MLNVGNPKSICRISYTNVKSMIYHAKLIYNAWAWNIKV